MTRRATVRHSGQIAVATSSSVAVTYTSDCFWIFSDYLENLTY